MATNAQLQAFEALFRVFDKDNSGPFYLMQNGTLGHGAFELFLKEFVLGDASKSGS